MTQARVLVTGAGGYVGRHVVTALAGRGVEVFAVVRPGSPVRFDSSVTVIEADILAPAFDPTSLLECKPTVLIHLAWQDGFRHNSPSHIELVSSHFRFLRLAAEAGVARISVLGTMHEIGYWEGAIEADTPTAPVSLYGIAKDTLRKASFAQLSSITELQWLRCFYIYGDDRNNQSIFTRILEAADAGTTSFPFTSGVNRFDFIEVDMLGRQIATVALEDGVTGIVNCCTGNPVSLGEKVEQFIASNQLDVTLEYGAFPDRPYDSPGVWGDATDILRIMAAQESRDRVGAPPTS